MPNKDGTGPKGIGSMTGKRMGFCGHGQRTELGKNHQQREKITTNITTADQKKVLEAQLKELENEKQAIETKLKEFE